MREAFFNGFHRSLPAFVGAGNNVIVEHIVEAPEWMRQPLTVLHGFDVFFVGVHCPLDELERREAARDDRPLGGARRDFETVHRDVMYDLELDGLQAPTTNALTVISAWRQRTQPSAFVRMAAALGPDASSLR